MNKKIHATAVVNKKAHLDKDVEVGPYSLIGPGVSIGRGTKIMSHVVIDGLTQIGKECVFFPGVCAGLSPQVAGHKAKKTTVVIGDHNVLRENVTVHAGKEEGAKTVLGDRNFLMVGAHVAHDCQLGDDIVMANLATLAGHVTVEDKVILGGMVGVHQFVRIGKMSMVGGMTKIVKDVPPFSLCDGHPAKLYGVNAIGLKRAGFGSQEVLTIRKAFQVLRTPKISLANKLKKIETEFSSNPEIKNLVQFIENSKRGILSNLPEG